MSQASILQLNQVSKSFVQANQSIEVLKGLDLEVGTGTTVAIVGESGAGKSTLLSILSGLESPDRGSIQFFGIPFGDLNMDEYRLKDLGIVFQSFYLIPYLTALENVMTPIELQQKGQAKQIATDALEEVGLKNRLNNYPSQLSGGEQQRVAIARAIVTQPKLILADEPTGNLDPKTGEVVMEYLFEECRKHNIALVLVTHNLDLAKRCDSVFRLKNGRLEGYEN